MEDLKYEHKHCNQTIGYSYSHLNVYEQKWQWDIQSTGCTNLPKKKTMQNKTKLFCKSQTKKCQRKMKIKTKSIQENFENWKMTKLKETSTYRYFVFIH